MGIERAVRIRSIQEPVPAFLVGNDVDDTSNGIRSETYGNHTFIYLYTVGKAHRNIVQAEGASHTFLRHTVNEHLDVLSAKTVQHQLHIRTYPTRLTEFHARSLGQGIAQILRGVLEFLCIDCHSIECRPLHPAYSGRNDSHLVQLLRFGSDGYVQLHPLIIDQFHLFLHLCITYGRHHQRIVAGRRLDVIEAFLIRGSSITRPFQINSRKIHRFFFRRNDSTRNHPSSPLRMYRQRSQQKEKQQREFKCICFQFYNNYNVVSKPVQRSLLTASCAITYCR